MFVASTPLDARKRRRTGAFDVHTPGISPIRKRGDLEVNPYRLPKLPSGTTLEALRTDDDIKVETCLLGPPSKERPFAENLNVGSLPGPKSKKRPLLENLNMGNVPIATIESLGYLNGINPLPPPSMIPKRRQSSATKTTSTKQKRKTVDLHAHRSSQAVVEGINSNLMSVDRASKNASHFPELVVISDDEEESHLSVNHRTRRSVSSRKKTSAVVPNGVSNVPSLNDFVKLGSKSVAESRNSMFSGTATVKYEMLPAVAENGDRYISGRNSTVIKSDPQDFKTIRSTRSRGRSIVKNEKLPFVVGNGIQTATNKDTYEFNSESQPHSESEIAKFSVAEVDSWKELKEQPGVFFSKAPAPQSSGSDGDAFPARAGYLKMEAKKMLDIQTCANNVVFTVVKGKGRIKNKTEIKGSNAKTEMIVGDILTIPQGSTFNFTNLGTKNDLVMSYVKLA